MKDRLEKQLQFLKAADALKSVSRKTWILGGNRLENLEDNGDGSYSSFDLGRQRTEGMLHVGCGDLEKRNRYPLESSGKYLIWPKFNEASFIKKLSLEVGAS